MIRQGYRARVSRLPGAPEPLRSASDSFGLRPNFTPMASPVPARCRAPDNVFAGFTGDVPNERGQHLAKLMGRVGPGLGKRPVRCPPRSNVVEDAQRLERAASGQPVERGDNNHVASLNRSKQSLQFVPVVLGPLSFSQKMRAHPTAFSCASWISSSCPLVLTRAYP